MIRVPRMVAAATAVLAVALGSPGVAQASPGQSPAAPPSAPQAGESDALPKGWKIAGSGAGRELVWRSPRRVPMGDARVEFHSGGRLIGRPVADDDGRTFRLRLGPAAVGAGGELEVLAGGRRLDAHAGAGADRDRARGTSPARPVTSLPSLKVDPGVPGGHRTVSGEYSLDPVKLPGFPEPVEMRATVVAPADARGSRPLALFLHGRHSTCYGGEGQETGDWPCPAGTRPVPSHRGYQHDQRLLASQGYVTVSISANGVNGQDFAAEDGGAQARSSLVRRHLTHWADWASDRSGAPDVVRGAPRADLSRVLLVGHSRGGEGVNRAALDSLYPPPAEQDGAPGPARWDIRGTVLIGPTVFGHNPVPDVPSVTILPGCDGDVSDLQGEIYLDGTRGVGRGSALHSAVYMVGANHNFFNTEWTPGQAEAPAWDDFPGEEEERDPVCSPGTKTRLTAAQQQKAGSTYIAAAARLFVAGDDRVRPLLDGSGVRAPSAGSARVLTHAVGANRAPGLLPDSSLAVSGGRVCAQVDPDAATACLSPDGPGASPHFARWETRREPGRHAVAMRWSKAGSAVRMTPGRPFSVAGSQALALRVIVPPNTAGTELDVAVTDTSGRRAVLGRARVDGLPGSERTASHWAREVRVPLRAAAGAGVDLAAVKTLELTPRGAAGEAWLMDAWGWRPGTPAARPGQLPRVDIGRLAVREGDSGTRTYHVPVRVSGPGSGQVRLFVADPATGEATARTVTVGGGGEAVDVPVTVEGNVRHGEDREHRVFVKAVRGAVVGAHSGGMTVADDDPMPAVSAAPVADRVTEGGKLVWRVSLSRAADVPVFAGFDVLAPASGTELSTADVDRRWLDEQFGVGPAPQRPLSRLMEEPMLFAEVPAGALSVDVAVPTVADRVREPEEVLRLRLVTFDENWDPQRGPEFTGRVRDAS
ncbi:alpha/beta hydrolase family protein [Streptomyces capparidis]